MKKILLIETGGTISCQEENGELTPSPSITDAVWKQYQKEHPGEAHFTVIKPYTILSENLLPDRWIELTAAINQARPEEYSGVIVTHGTDSIDFTRAFLHYHYGPGIQVIGALYPPADSRTDAFGNFQEAVRRCGPIEARKFCYPLRRGLVITAYPGLDYSLYTFGDEVPDFIIHMMYHSGTGCTASNRRYDLGTFVQKAGRSGIPVYAVGFPGNSNIYAGHRALWEKGLRFVPDLSFPQLLVKLTLGLKLP